MTKTINDLKQFITSTKDDWDVMKAVRIIKHLNSENVEEKAAIFYFENGNVINSPSTTGFEILTAANIRNCLEPGSKQFKIKEDSNHLPEAEYLKLVLNNVLKSSNDVENTVEKE